MSKVTQKIMSLVLVAVLAMALLAGCGGSKSEIVGTWEATKVEASGITLDFKEFAQQMGQDADSFKMELTAKDDKTFSMNMAGETGEGTWEEKSGKYVLTADGEDMEVQIEDGKLIFADEALGGAKITFEKK